MKMPSLKLLSLLTLGALSALPLTLHADQISDATYLRKLSFHLRGYQPQPSEYDALGKSSDHAAFLDAKIQEYMKTPDHAERMLFRLTNMFAFQTPSFRMNQTERFNTGNGYYSVSNPAQDAASDLFRRMGSENLSWDQLLLAKKYNLFVPAAGQGFQGFGNDFTYLQIVQPSLAPYALQSNNGSNTVTPAPSPLEGQHIPITFADDDSRIAGALTTDRFGQRYRNSALNKNRRRAAAVFRIFLCDSMSQGFIQEADKKEDHLNSVFETDGTMTEDQLRQSLKNTSAEAQHGKLQACVGCHYKLDPMGKTFQSMTESLFNEPSPGVLSYKHKNGDPVHIPVDGIGDLAKAITLQPEYANCQVDWFWKEFIGVNVPITEQRRTELVQSFNSVGRRTNDFITILLKSPEFRQRPESSAFVTFARVQPLLKRCDSCHSTSETANAPTLATMPYMDGGTDTTSNWLKKISKRLNLPVDSKDHMPRHSEEWSPSDLQLLKDWISGGAHDDKGLVRLPPAAPTTSPTAGAGK